MKWHVANQIVPQVSFHGHPAMPGPDQTQGMPTSCPHVDPQPHFSQYSEPEINKRHHQEGMSAASESLSLPGVVRSGVQSGGPGPGPWFSWRSTDKDLLSFTLFILWVKERSTSNKVSKATPTLEGHHGGTVLVGARIPCTTVPCWSIWNTVLEDRRWSKGARVETPTGNSGSCTVSLSFTTTLPTRRDAICILSFPRLCRSQTAGGKEFST